jgi:hypothetical protein
VGSNLTGGMDVCCECCVLSGRGLCDKLITRPEESYRLWCVVVCDLENLENEEAMTCVRSQWYSKKKSNVVCILHVWGVGGCNSRSAGIAGASYIYITESEFIHSSETNPN